MGMNGNYIRAFDYDQESLVEGYSYPYKFFRSLLFRQMDIPVGRAARALEAKCARHALRRQDRTYLDNYKWRKFASRVKE